MSDDFKRAGRKESAGHATPPNNKPTSSAARTRMKADLRKELPTLDPPEHVKAEAELLDSDALDPRDEALRLARESLEELLEECDHSPMPSLCRDCFARAALAAIDRALKP